MHFPHSRSRRRRLRQGLLAAGLGVTLIPAAFAAKKPASIDPSRLYQTGLAHLQQGRPDLAVKELEKAVAYRPDDTIATYTLGLACYGMHDLERAKQVLKGLLVQDPLFTDAHNSLGIIYSDQGDHVRARAEFEQVLADKHYQTPEVAQFNLGALLLDDGNVEEAVKYLHSAAVAKPDNVDWRFRHGVALEKLKQFDAARKEFDAAVAGRATFIEALFHLGTMSLELKDRDKAKWCFARVRDLAPNTPMADQSTQFLKDFGS